MQLTILGDLLSFLSLYVRNFDLSKNMTRKFSRYGLIPQPVLKALQAEKLIPESFDTRTSRHVGDLFDVLTVGRNKRLQKKFSNKYDPETEYPSHEDIYSRKYRMPGAGFSKQ
jgi:hypothetical protein